MFLLPADPFASVFVSDVSWKTACWPRCCVYGTAEWSDPDWEPMKPFPTEETSCMLVGFSVKGAHIDLTLHLLVAAIKLTFPANVLSDSFAHYCVCVTVMIFHWTWMLHSYWHLLCSLFTVWHHGCAVGRTFSFLNIFQIFVFSLVFSGVCPEFRKLQCQIKHTQPAGKGQKDWRENVRVNK